MRKRVVGFCRRGLCTASTGIPIWPAASSSATGSIRPPGDGLGNRPRLPGRKSGSTKRVRPSAEDELKNGLGRDIRDRLCDQPLFVRATLHSEAVAELWLG